MGPAHLEGQNCHQLKWRKLWVWQGGGADQEFGHMYQISSGDIEQMVRYTNLEFDREIWAGDLIGEVKVKSEG